MTQKRKRQEQVKAVSFTGLLVHYTNLLPSINLFYIFYKFILSSFRQEC